MNETIDKFSKSGRFELISFYDGTYFELLDGGEVMFQGNKEDLEEVRDIIQIVLDNL